MSFLHFAIQIMSYFNKGTKAKFRPETGHESPEE
jgi:hypothetical protein